MYVKFQAWENRPEKKTDGHGYSPPDYALAGGSEPHQVVPKHRLMLECKECSYEKKASRLPLFALQEKIWKEKEIPTLRVFNSEAFDLEKERKDSEEYDKVLKENGSAVVKLEDEYEYIYASLITKDGFEAILAVKGAQMYLMSDNGKTIDSEICLA